MEVIIGLVFVVFARFLATDVVTLRCNTALDISGSSRLPRGVRSQFDISHVLARAAEDWLVFRRLDCRAASTR